MSAGAAASLLEEVEEEVVLSEAVDSRACTDSNTFSSLTERLGSDTTVLP